MMRTARCGDAKVRLTVKSPFWTKYMLRSIAANYPPCNGNKTWTGGESK